MGEPNPDPSADPAGADGQKFPDARTEPSATNRLYISVPCTKTYVVAGEGIGDGDPHPDHPDPKETFAFPGFGVMTRSHVFMDARGDAHKSRMKLQAQGEITIHSNEMGVNIGGSKAVMLGSSGPASMFGETGVVIGSGWGLGLIASGLQKADRYTSPATPPWVSSVRGVTQGFGALLAAVDAGMGYRQVAVEAQRGKNALDINLDAAKFSTLWSSMLATGLSGGTALFSAMSAAGVEEKENASTRFPSLLTASTLIFGQSGIALGSPAAIGIYSVLGTSIFSQQSVSIDSNNLASLSAKKAVSIVSSGAAELVAADKLFVIGTEMATLGSKNHIVVRAPEVDLRTPSGDVWVGLGDKKDLWLLANSKVTIETDEFICRTDTASLLGVAGVSVKSEIGNVSIEAPDGMASMDGAKGAKIVSGDAMVALRPGTIALTVGCDLSNSDHKWKVDRLDAELEEISHEWQSEHLRKNHDAQVEWKERYNRLVAKRRAAEEEYESALLDAADAENGILIGENEIVLAVGNEMMSLTQGKVKVLDALLVKG